MFTEKAAPDWARQLVQWQAATASGAPLIRHDTAPQLHLPVASSPVMILSSFGIAQGLPSARNLQF
jgi:hypothetical protein